MEFRKKKPEKMSDGELLQELDRMIASAEAQAHPNPAASAILESLHPAMKAAMPETVKKAKQNLRALKQAKERLMDLMVEVASAISYTSPGGETVNANHEAIGNHAFAFVGTSGVQMGWLASQADMLADDWTIVE